MMDIGIVIQGPLTFVKELAPYISTIEYLVWSTWEGETEDAINILKQNKIDFILSPPPSTPGHWNINFQCLSSEAGIKYLKKKYPKIGYFVKIRGDIAIVNVDKFLINLKASLKKGNNIISLGLIKTYHKAHISSFYMNDFIVAGSFNEMILFFKYSEENGNGLPYPEKWLENRYFGEPNYIKKNRVSLIKNGFFFSSKGIKYISFKLNINFERDITDYGYLYFAPTRAQEFKYLFIELPIKAIKKLLKILKNKR